MQRKVWVGLASQKIGKQQQQHDNKTLKTAFKLLEQM